MKTYNLDCNLNELPPSGHGVYSVIIKHEDLLPFLNIESIYERTGIALKVFREKATSIEEFTWGIKDRHPKLMDATIIQNLFAYRGVAPRVYDLIKIKCKNGNEHFAQITDFIEGEHSTIHNNSDLWGSITEIGMEYNLYRQSDVNEKNIVGGKWVDFQILKFNYKEGYRKKIMELSGIHNPCSREGKPYVDIAGIEVKGMRNLKHRLEVYKFDEINFKDKTVVDWGCNAGQFCREVYKRGAKRVVGLEGNGGAVRTAREISNYLGMFNIDFHQINLRTKEGQSGVFHNIKKVTGFDNFDIHLFLSMDQHVGYPKGVGKIVNDFMLVEGGVAQGEQYFRNLMKDDFREIEFVGYTTDHARRVVLKGIK